MADVLILEFNGGTADHYNTVNGHLGIDPKTGEGDWPQGLLSHTGATTANGDLVVVEVWDTKDAQAAFMNDRLGPALGKAEVPEPSRMEWLLFLGHHGN